ncbi:hypothetical protein ZTR_00043 [Talaromyces verruculosus]|nr:hypothetical protein ZTR_00043 [Talaromyces verruculosus]
MSLSTFEKLLERNKEYVPKHVPLPSVADMRATPMPPGFSQTVIIACSDPRVSPELFLNIAPGDLQASFIRVAGGRAIDALRSLIVLDGMLKISTVVVIHHTDCGLTHQTNEAIRDRIKLLAPYHASKIDEMGFGHIHDHESALNEDVAYLKDSPFLTKDVEVVGYLYDLKTGALNKVA